MREKSVISGENGAIMPSDLAPTSSDGELLRKLPALDRGSNARIAEFCNASGMANGVDVEQKYSKLTHFSGGVLIECVPSASVSLPAQARQQIANVVQRVFVVANSAVPRTVVFSGIDNPCRSGEICFHTAQALAAELAKSVCLVVTEKTTSLYSLFDIADRPGLSEALSRPDPISDFTVQVKDENLWLLPAGSLSTGASGTFASDRMRLRLQELRKAFGYVLIDAPAVSSGASAVLLGQMADGVILVIEANSTRRETARMAKETFDRASVKVFGAILNNHVSPTPKIVLRKS